MLKKFKEALKRDSFRAPTDKGLVNYIKRKITPRVKIPNRNISIFLTTNCNLNCFSCGALGMNPRPKVEYTQLGDIELFLGQMQGIYPNSFIMLTGGEPTLYPDLKKVCALIREYGFRVSMLTNGYNKVPVEWFDAIMIDYHGESNRIAIAEWKLILEKSDIIWDMHDKRHHQDMNVAMENNITKGLRCSNFLRPLTLWKKVIFPCCNIMCLEWWHNDDSVTKGFTEARWTVDNENFADTFRDWRDTLPLEFYKMCSLKCWKDSKNREWHKLRAQHANEDRSGIMRYDILNKK